ncbi:hypothetical protein [Nostoc sp.]
MTQSRHIIHPVSTYSGIDLPERIYVVTSFLIVIGREFRFLLFTGVTSGADRDGSNSGHSTLAFWHSLLVH